jgi:hypothetical protein
LNFAFHKCNGLCRYCQGDIAAGTIAAAGKADIIMHPPMDDKFRLETVLKEFAKTLRQTFQHYCTAGAAGENDPFKLTLTQWFLFGADMKLPEVRRCTLCILLTHLLLV